eukprot:m.28427 g.28427  ORF g.28427 m.28427 type:complete len:61 (-) comp11835_c0_seq1:70-252(-)
MWHSLMAISAHFDSEYEAKLQGNGVTGKKAACLGKFVSSCSVTWKQANMEADSESSWHSE